MTSKHAIGEGDALPDVPLVDHGGRPWRFSDNRGRPLVLVLHRHLA
jgi:peroxiredoxin